MEGIQIEYLKTSNLKPYKSNARKHAQKDIEAIMHSIEEFGFLDPIGIWGTDNTIVEGHGRLAAAKKLGMKEVPCIRLDSLTDEQRKAYCLAHNKTAELSVWDFDALNFELDSLTMDMTPFGFEINTGSEWFNEHESGKSTEGESEEYKEFLDKFEQAKTTDDCYTPDIVYDAVLAYVRQRYGIRADEETIRPFYPGGDYQKERYPKNCVVIDNPPFSIMSEIIKFYVDRGIRFFLFAPALTTLGSCANKCTAICTGVGVIYENGANVSTSFVTNMENHSIRAKSDAELYRIVRDANEKEQRKSKSEIPTYEYPDYIVTAAMIQKYSKYGVTYELRQEQSCMVRELDEQKEKDKSIYGSGYLLSEKAAAEKAAAEKAAAEKAAAEKAAAEKWQLSAREKEIVRELSKND